MADQSCKTPRWRMLKSQLNNLSPKDFLQKIKSEPDSIIIDVRKKQEFEAGHILNAVHIDYLDDQFWDKIEKLPTDVSIFVYCRSGRRSIRACTLMGNGGFDRSRIFNLEGGFAEWPQQSN